MSDTDSDTDEDLAAHRERRAKARYGLTYGKHKHTLTLMKTTIDIDEAKLKRVMRLTGLKTRKAAVDFALSEAERLARVDQLFRRPFFVTRDPVIDPAYDVIRLRELDKPGADDPR